MNEFRGRLLFASSALGSFGIPAAGALVLGFDPLRAGFIGGGLTLFLLVLLKPSWFWYHFEIEAMRELLGNRIVAGIYHAVAAFLLYLGITAQGLR